MDTRLQRGSRPGSNTRREHYLPHTIAKPNSRAPSFGKTPTLLGNDRGDHASPCSFLASPGSPIQDDWLLLGCCSVLCVTSATHKRRFLRTGPGAVRPMRFFQVPPNFFKNEPKKSCRRLVALFTVYGVATFPPIRFAVCLCTQNQSQHTALTPLSQRLCIYSYCLLVRSLSRDRQNKSTALHGGPMKEGCHTCTTVQQQYFVYQKSTM